MMVNACIQTEVENDDEFDVEHVHSESYVHKIISLGYLYPMKMIEYFLFKMKMIMIQMYLR